MERTSGYTKGRLLAFLCCIILPLCAMGLGIPILTNHIQFTIPVAITYVLIPLIAEGLLAWCIFSQCQTLIKVFLSALILIFFMVIFWVLHLAVPYIKVKHYEGAEAKVQYAAVQQEKELLPELSTIGQPECIEYHSTSYSAIIFRADTDYLICKYTPEEYEIQKEALETAYTFQMETITTYDEHCAPSAYVDGYHFRFLSLETYKERITYPKDFVLIGYSGEAKEIVYLAFEDWELDTISSLEDLILDDCCWKYIR